MSERALDVDRLRTAVAAGGWATVEVVASAGSTNADLAERARAGADVPAALLTTHQTAGRGRLDRTWETPPDSAIACSVLLAPPRPAAEWSWLPLLAGVAVCRALEAAAGVAAGLKWPNDVLVEDGAPAAGGHPGKVCGILAERVETPAGPACVVGLGLNVELAADALPVPAATALNLVGATTLDRTTLAAALLDAVATTVAAWDVGAYAERCLTLGREVQVEHAGGVVTGRAESIDESGRLVVSTETGPRVFSAGDVIHLR